MQSTIAAKPPDTLPGRLLKDPLGLGLALLLLLAMSAALYAALVFAPTERLQGDVWNARAALNQATEQRSSQSLASALRDRLSQRQVPEEPSPQ